MKLKLLALVSLLIGLAMHGFAQAAEAERSAARIVADKALECTVGITCKTNAYLSNGGTGFVISPDGHILTATSVVPPSAKSIRVTFPGFVSRDAKIVASSKELAVTLIKVEASGLPALSLARGLPALGSTAYTVADVQNALLTNGRALFSRGIVSGIYDVPKNPEADYAGVAIETTAAVNPGSDGGPMLNEQGQVCGVITMGILPLRWQGTAVPMQVLLERFGPLAANTPALQFDPLPGLAAQAPGPPLRAAADEMARSLVGVEVERKHPAEILPRVSLE